MDSVDANERRKESVQAESLLREGITKGITATIQQRYSNENGSNSHSEV